MSFIDHPTARNIIDRYSKRTMASKEHDARAKKSLPGGDTRTLTYLDPYPAYMTRGEGCYLFDADGNRYLDTLNNYTSLIHGHAHEATQKAAIDQLNLGTIWGAPGEIGYVHAEHLKKRLPAMERIRYCNSGTEATMFAIRAARAHTGKDGIVKIDGSYHGSHDAVEVNIKADYEALESPRARLEPGAPNSILQDVFIARYNDLDALEDVLKAHGDVLAAVIIEPIMGAGGMIMPLPGYMKGVRELTEKYGILLILDEIVTFRLAWGGRQGVEDIRPDLITLGKTIGGGFPVGAFGGRADIMAHFEPSTPVPITHTGTFNASNIVLIAGLATLQALDKAAIDRLNGLGGRLRDGFNEALGNAGIAAVMSGYGSLTAIHWRPQKAINAGQSFGSLLAAQPIPRLLHMELMNQGVYSAPRGMYNLSTPMEQSQVDQAIQAFAAALETVKPAMVDLAPHLLSSEKV